MLHPNYIRWPDWDTLFTSVCVCHTVYSQTSTLNNSKHVMLLTNDN